MTDIGISIVVAVSANGIIGRDGDMPWRLSTDLRRFKALTLGKPLIMGRKTFESIGSRPLPGRPHIIVTRNGDFRADGVEAAHSLEAAIGRAKAIADESGAGEICIAGGGDIYRQALDRADTLRVTHVETVVDGDTRFPEIDPAVWDAGPAETVAAGDKDNYPTRFVTYRRKNAVN